MSHPVPVPTPAERRWLIALAAVGFVLLNGAFLYGVATRPGGLAATLADPIAAAFMIEALLLTVLAAWLVHRWRPSRLGWRSFVLLSLVGGLAFSIPILLLLPKRAREA